MDFNAKESLGASTTEVCTSLYVGELEIVIDKPYEGMDSLYDTFLDHDADPPSYLRIARHQLTS